MFNAFLQLLSITENIVYMRGILCVPFRKEAKRLFLAMALYTGLLLYEGINGLGSNAIIFYVILETLLVPLVFEGRKGKNILKLYFSIFSMGFFSAPIKTTVSILIRSGKISLTDEERRLVCDILLLLVLVSVSLGVKHYERWKQMALSFPSAYFAVGFGICFCADGVTNFFLASFGKTTVETQVFYEILCLGLKEFIYLFGVGIVIMDQLRKQYRQESLMKSQYMDILSENYAEEKKNREEIRSLRHDMKRHLELTELYLEQGEIENAKKYLKEITEDAKNLQIPMIDTGNEFVNAVIFNETRKTSEMVTVYCEGKLQGQVEISNYDLCTIFGNLIANAAEACQHLRHHAKEIHIRIGRSEGHLVVRVENPVEWKVDEKQLEGVSTKENKKEHGYGIRNVKDTVKRYGGELFFEREEGKFIVNLLF